MGEQDPTIQEQLESRRMAWVDACIRHNVSPPVGDELRKAATNVLRWELADFMWMKMVNAHTSEEKKLWAEANKIVLNEGF